MISEYDKKFLQDWMSLSRDEISHKWLVNLFIPATHNSNTDTVQGILKPFAKN